MAERIKDLQFTPELTVGIMLSHGQDATLVCFLVTLYLPKSITEFKTELDGIIFFFIKGIVTKVSS